MRQRPSVHIPDEVCLFGGVALVAAAVPIVIWTVEALFGLFR